MNVEPVPETTSRTFTQDLQSDSIDSDPTQPRPKPELLRLRRSRRERRWDCSRPGNPRRIPDSIPLKDRPAPRSLHRNYHRCRSLLPACPTVSLLGTDSKKFPPINWHRSETPAASSFAGWRTSSPVFSVFGVDSWTWFGSSFWGILPASKESR